MAVKTPKNTPRFISVYSTLTGSRIITGDFDGCSHIFSPYGKVIAILNASDGDVNFNDFGNFAFQPAPDFEGDYTFVFEVCYISSSDGREICQDRDADGSTLVATITVGGRSSRFNNTDTTPIEPHTKKGGNGPDLAELIDPFQEAGFEQEEQLHEGTDLTVEAFVEFFEVVIEHLDEIGNENAAEALSALRQAFLDGNYEAIPALFELLPADLGDALANLPEAVQIAAAEKMLPRLEQSSQALSAGLVPLNVADEAIAAVEQQMPDSDPNKAEVLQLLNEARELILARNEAIEEILTIQNQVIAQLQALSGSE